MKKVFFILILTIILFLQNSFANNEQSPENTYLLQYKYYKKINPQNINLLKITRYTEAGAGEQIISDKTSINYVYDFLKTVKVSEKSKMSCTDNSTIYLFELKDNSKIPVEIECSWIVIDGKNYNFTIRQPIKH